MSIDLHAGFVRLLAEIRVCSLQVSISGQAVVFVVRTLQWSPIAVAGRLTYIAFVLAQVHTHYCPPPKLSILSPVVRHRIKNCCVITDSVCFADCLLLNCSYWLQWLCIPFQQPQQLQVLPLLHWWRRFCILQEGVTDLHSE